jgi:hypothetical protein
MVDRIGASLFGEGNTKGPTRSRSFVIREI